MSYFVAHAGSTRASREIIYSFSDTISRNRFPLGLLGLAWSDLSSVKLPFPTPNWPDVLVRWNRRCVFSIGGDGALHVLDDADAHGYIKPPPISSARRKKRKKVLSNNPGRGASGGRAHNNHYHQKIGAVCSEDDDSAGKQGGRWDQGRTAAQHERVRPDAGKIEAGGAMPQGAETGVRKGGGAGEAVDGSNPADGLPAGVRKRGDGGRSVLLRQVVLSSNDDDDDSEATKNDDDINDEHDRERGCGAGGGGRRSYDPTGRSDRRGPGSPPSQQPRGTLGASRPELDRLNDDGLSTEPPGSASSSGKSR